MGKMRDNHYQIILVFEKRQYNATRGCGIALPTLTMLLCISMEGTTALYVLQRKVITLPSLPKSIAPNFTLFISASPPYMLCQHPFKSLHWLNCTQINHS